MIYYSIWYLAFMVEVRQCRLKLSDIKTRRGPALKFDAVCSLRLRSWRTRGEGQGHELSLVVTNCFAKFGQQDYSTWAGTCCEIRARWFPQCRRYGRGRRRRKTEGGIVPFLKSRDPHLAGEKQNKPELLFNKFNPIRKHILCLHAFVCFCPLSFSPHKSEQHSCIFLWIENCPTKWNFGLTGFWIDIIFSLRLIEVSWNFGYLGQNPRPKNSATPKSWCPRNSWAYLCIVGLEPDRRSVCKVLRKMGVSENSVPLIPMVNDHYPY